MWEEGKLGWTFGLYKSLKISALSWFTRPMTQVSISYSYRNIVLIFNLYINFHS